MTTPVLDPLAAFAEELGPLRLPRAYCPVEPTAKQEWFLRRHELEVFLGGAAGPGKSYGLLMAALMYVDVPGYDAVILRTVLQDHEKRKALIPTAHAWLGGTDAHWNGSLRQWAFPSGATLSFGYLKTLADLSHWKGPAYSFVGFDELTEFPEEVYLGISRVLRDSPPIGDDGLRVPLRKRAASNPGGLGHSWVKTRFIDPRSRADGAVFIPATIHDNPHMDYAEYMLSLAHLSPIDQLRLINGDWDVSEEGGKFHKAGLPIVDPATVLPPVARCRYWDLAGTEPHPSNTDPDYTVGVLYEVDAAGTFTVRHVARGQWADHVVEDKVRVQAEADGRDCHVFVEQDPGQAGKAQVGRYIRKVLQGFPAHAGSTRINGQNAAKEVRARAVAAACGNGLVQVARGENVVEFVNELVLFPNGVHDDCVDALSGAHTALTTRVMRSGSGRGMTTHRPQGRLPGAAEGARAAGGPGTVRPR